NLQLIIRTSGFFVDYVTQSMPPRPRPINCSYCNAPLRTNTGCSCTGGKSHICLHREPMRHVLTAWQRVAHDGEHTPTMTRNTTTTTTTATTTTTTVTVTVPSN
ncbi:MAG: hypothetical protein VX704_04685, partial [Verrucomicrobiota bacterium]|nr:hypothetical protein [Verrucomicrobiota bacterium]